MLLSGNLPPHHLLRDLATKYGPLMHLQIGEVSVVIVTSAELAKEFLQTQDIIFGTRSYVPSGYTLFYQGRDIVFGNGEYWRQMRKICIRELLGTNRVKSFLPIIKEEVYELVRSIQQQQHGSSPSAINIGEVVRSVGFSVISRTAFGKIQTHVDSFSLLGREILKGIEGPNLWDLFPSSYLVRRFTSTESKLKKLHNEVDAVFQTIIDDHIAKRSAKTTVDEADDDDQDLVDVLLNHNLHQDLEIPITIYDIKAVLLDICLAGSDTSPVNIESALLELMRDSRVMEKVQKEVRDYFDGKGKIDYEDLDHLPYLKLVIKEAMRLHPPAPLLGPREAREPAVVCGYHIPAKTRIIVNVWAIARDHCNWPDPERFYPERFLNDLSSGSDYFKGLDFSIIPFGAGRRICPGIQFGMALVTFALANLLYHFDWELPPGVTSQNLDMSTNLFLIPIPRHPKVL
ncbi:Cytochrome P450 71D11 (Fragment) [Linum grandiflorum]